VRPRDARGIYRDPGPQFARLARAGALLRLADGYYVVVPDDRGAEWRPGLEASAAGIAAAIYGPADAILMGISAARVHGAVPRAVGVATVAVPRQHRPITLTGVRGGVVHFSKRDVARLDARQESLGELGRGLVTTPEQTALDLARPRDPYIDFAQVQEALHSLMPLCDAGVLEELAHAQRLRAALTRLRRATT
jgi:hypothetical protein